MWDRRMTMHEQEREGEGQLEEEVGIFMTIPNASI